LEKVDKEIVQLPYDDDDAYDYEDDSKKKFLKEHFLYILRSLVTEIQREPRLNQIQQQAES